MSDGSPSGITPRDTLCAIETVRESKLRSNAPQDDHEELKDDIAAEWNEASPLDALAVDGLDFEYTLLLKTPTLQ